MPELEFRDPIFLLAIVLAPLVYLLAWRTSASVTYASLAIADVGPRSLRVRLARLPALLTALAVAALAVALAGPRSGDATTHVKREGIAIMLSIDRSGSMRAVDFAGNDANISRLDAVKDVLRQFVGGGDAGQGRPDDLIGLIAFGTYADGLCPLTLDHGNLLAILADAEIPEEETEQATAVGEGLGLAVERLREQEAVSKIVILLTDGVNNAGVIDPLVAADLAANHDIKVYTIGAGRSGFAPFPVTDRHGRTFLQRARVEIDEESLREIAKRTGGRYFHAEDAEGLADIYREIDRLERSEITEIRYLRYREHYSIAVLAALLLMAVAATSAATVLRRLP